MAVKIAVLGQDKKSLEKRRGTQIWQLGFFGHLHLSLSTLRLPLPVSCYKTGCSKLHEDPAEPVSSTPFGFLPL